MAKRTPWSQEELDKFREWHEMRMDLMNYSPEIRAELRKARDIFLPTPTKK